MTNVHPSHCSLVFGFVAKYISAGKNSFGVNTFLEVKTIQVENGIGVTFTLIIIQRQNGAKRPSSGNRLGRISHLCSETPLQMGEKK